MTFHAVFDHGDNYGVGISISDGSIAISTGSEGKFCVFAHNEDMTQWVVHNGNSYINATYAFDSNCNRMWGDNNGPSVRLPYLTDANKRMLCEEVLEIFKGGKESAKWQNYNLLNNDTILSDEPEDTPIAYYRKYLSVSKYNGLFGNINLHPSFPERNTVYIISSRDYEGYSAPWSLEHVIRYVAYQEQTQSDIQDNDDRFYALVR